MAGVTGVEGGVSGIKVLTDVGVLGDSLRGTGVAGLSQDFAGVYGLSIRHVGVKGWSDSVGVEGEGGFRGMIASASDGAGIEANCNSGPGVYANSNQHAGVYAYSLNGSAVYATSGKGSGVLGIAQDSGTGVVGLSVNGFAGEFHGPVAIYDALTVYGSKSAVVKHPDGSHRTLYSLECPESWFEDFGEGRLRGGRASVKLDRTFRRLVRTGGYHVFLTPRGDCNGLYVSGQGSAGFEVRELRKGKSTLAFSYRIVARRRDVEAPRFARVTTPPRARHPREARLERPAKLRIGKRKARKGSRDL